MFVKFFILILFSVSIYANNSLESVYYVRQEKVFGEVLGKCPKHGKAFGGASGKFPNYEKPKVRFGINILNKKK